MYLMLRKCENSSSKNCQCMWTRFSDSSQSKTKCPNTWWRHQMETFSALLAICAENSPVPGEFSTQRPVTRSFDVYFDLQPNKGLSKQLWGWWFETQACPLWRHRNDILINRIRSSNVSLNLTCRHHLMNWVKSYLNQIYILRIMTIFLCPGLW